MDIGGKEPLLRGRAMARAILVVVERLIQRVEYP